MFVWVDCEGGFLYGWIVRVGVCMGGYGSGCVGWLCVY